VRYVVEFISENPITGATLVEIVSRLHEAGLSAYVGTVAPYDMRLDGQVQGMDTDTREELEWLVAEVDSLLIDIVPDRYVHAVGYEGLGCGG
jgi:hypothetical protein